MERRQKQKLRNSVLREMCRDSTPLHPIQCFDNVRQLQYMQTRQSERAVICVSNYMLKNRHTNDNAVLLLFIYLFFRCIFHLSLNAIYLFVGIVRLSHCAIRIISVFCSRARARAHTRYLDEIVAQIQVIISVSPKVCLSTSSYSLYAIVVTTN